MSIDNPIVMDPADKVLSASLFMMKLLRKHLPKYEDGCEDFIIPEPREDWLTCLMLILFDSCASSFNQTGSDVMPKPLYKTLQINSSKESCVSYWIGSFYEGVECYIPNESPNPDILNVLRNYVATASKDECSDEEKRKIIVLKPGTDQCYAQLVDDGDIIPKIIKMAAANEEDRDRVDAIRDDKQMIINVTDCINYIGVECQKWPLQSKGWESRTRESEWPEKKVIEDCLALPCCIVPRRNPSNRRDRYEWQYYFARQEGILMESLSDEVKMMYIITRFLLRHKRITEEEKFSTYHLKSLLLWHCEEKCQDDFSYISLSNNVNEFLTFIAKQLEKREILHYFLEDFNMLKNIKFRTGEMNKKASELKSMTVNTNMLEVFLKITESKKYPFPLKFLANELKHKNLNNHGVYIRFQTDIISILAENVFKRVGYNQTRCNFFNKHLQSKYFIREKITLLAVVISLHAKDLDHTQELYGPSFTKLLLYAATLYEEDRAKVANLPPVSVISYDPEIIAHINLIPSIAKVFCYIGLKHAIKETYSLCKVVQEVIFKNDMQQEFFEILIQEMFENTDSLAETDGINSHLLMNSHLITRLRHIITFFHISKNDIEISMAKLIRLKKGSVVCIDNCRKLSYLLEDGTMSGVFKHLAYDMKRCVEDDLSKNKYTEVETILKNFLEILPDHFIVFQCLVTVIAFSLSAEKEVEAIKRLINFLLKSDSLTNFIKLIEICSVMRGVLSTGRSYDNMFLVAKSFGQKCCSEVGVKVVSDIFKHYLKPEHHLGLLMGIGLCREIDVNTEVDVYQTWISESLQAPVNQRNDLYFFAYSRLGHLYQIKSVQEERRSNISDADVHLQTAYKEDSKDLPLLVNMLVFTRTYKPHRYFLSLLDKALAVDHSSQSVVSKLASYYSPSAPCFDFYLNNLRYLIEDSEMFTATAVVLVNYIALKISGIEDEQFISRCVVNMEKGMKELAEMPDFNDTSAATKDDESPLLFYKRAVSYSHAVVGSYYLDKNDFENARLHFTKSVESYNKIPIVKRWLDSCMTI